MTPLERVLSKLPEARKNCRGWVARCPAHDDHTPSLSIAEGDGGRVLLKCHAKCRVEAIVAALGLGMAELFPANPTGTHPAARRNARPKIVATYDYRDEAGATLFQVVRFDPKDFRQRRPGPKGTWIWNLNGVRRVLYRLPEVLAAPADAWVFIPEGEKDVDRLTAAGIIATTNPCGAGKWSRVDDELLRGRRVCLLGDNDDAGRKHVADVATRLVGVAREVRVISLPGLPPQGDVSDWLGNHSVAQLLALLEQTPPYAPAALTARDLPEWQPFPVHLLPEPVQEYVTVTSRAIGCDPAYVALPLLAALAAAIGNSRRIGLKRGWTEPVILWAIIVGYSGTLKSPALDKALSAIHRRQRRALKEHTSAVQRYENELAQYDRDYSEWKKCKADAGPPPVKPTEPVAWRCLCSDTTVEAVAVMLQENQRGVLLVRDELAGWIGSFDQYRQGRGADAQHWIEMHGGRPLIVDRKSGMRKTIYIPRAAVCVTGGIQPDTLRRALTADFFANGLVARELFAMPPRLPKRWTDADIAPEQDAAVDRLFDRLFQLEAGIDGDGDPEPVIVWLDRAAKRLWIDFYNEHAKEQADLTGDLAAAWSKLEGYAARLALLVHCIRVAAGNPELTDPLRVDEMSISAGIALAQWFGAEDRRVYAVLAETDEEREERQLVELIRSKGGRITSRELMHASRKYRDSSELAEGALSGLVKAGWGHWVHEDHAGGPGRPKSVFELFSPGNGNAIADHQGENMVSLPLPQGLDAPPTGSRDAERDAVRGVEAEEEADWRRRHQRNENGSTEPPA